MEVTVVKNVLWYAFNQNNSGGYFVEDENQGPWVFIQAESVDAAWSKAQEMFDFGYCECCGERWHEPYEDGSEEPTVYGKLLSEVEVSWYRGYAILHHYNGVVERVDFKEKE